LYHDKDLNERSYLRSTNFPISFLTRNNIFFTDKNDQILLRNVVIKNDIITISMSLVLGDGNYSNFKLSFSLETVKLRFIEVLDANENPIHIKIISPKHNKKIDNKIFITAK
jgi:hypothetical protein